MSAASEKSVKASWGIVASFATILLLIGASQSEIVGLRKDVDAIQQSHPDTMSSEMVQHMQDVKDLKTTLTQVQIDCAYSRSSLDNLSKRLDDFNVKVAALESKVDSKQ
jgi:hypothetical protein